VLGCIFIGDIHHTPRQLPFAAGGRMFTQSHELTALGQLRSPAVRHWLEKGETVVATVSR
jgi:hypothetical protein